MHYEPESHDYFTPEQMEVFIPVCVDRYHKELAEFAKSWTTQQLIKELSELSKAQQDMKALEIIENELNIRLLNNKKSA